MDKKPTIVIIGAGASGLAAAISAAKQHTAQVILVERLNRAGKKLLATGNGRCNLENTSANLRSYHTKNARQLERMLESFSTQTVLDFFDECGLLCREEEEGRVYPASNQAASVLEVLRSEALHYGVKELCEWEVCEIVPQGKQFKLLSGAGETITAQAVILACGGKAAPKLGGTEWGYDLARALGHSLCQPYPCLSGLCCEKQKLSVLKGVRAECGVELWSKKQAAKRCDGEVQFNDYGVSGYPIMQLSTHLGKAGKDAFLCLDLIPQLTMKELVSKLHHRKNKYPTRPLEQLLTGLLHQKLAAYHLRAMFKTLDQPLSTLSAQMILAVCERLKGWILPIDGLPGWDSAQVTGGGIPLDEVTAQTFESKKCDGIYLVGELLDVAGDCGGYNLHWAFGSGIVAGTAAAENLR